MTSASVAAQADLDERILAQSALDAAEDNLQSLCASHAGTFVQVERRGKALQDGLAKLLAHLDQVQKTTRTAQEVLQQDEDGERPTLAMLAEQHRVRRRTLLQHSSLLELLELPSLMDACVRSNLYDEALSIAGLANTLERRSLDSSSTAAASSSTTAATGEGASATHAGWLVVQQVVEQIRQRQEDLRQQLWQRLSQASVTLPDCLEVVTALRRLNAIALERSSSTASQNLETIHAGMEVQLQIDFLEARDVWLETTTRSSAPVSGSGVAEDLLDTIERYRTRVFEIATQFNAIFRANATASSQTGMLSSVALLRLWMSRRVETFLQVLATQLATNVNETSHLRDALEAALFFATSLGRLGADFTARLPALFEPALVQIITTSWKDGAKQLAETLVTCREAGVAAPLSTWSTETVEAAPESNTAEEEGQPLRPPRMLLSYPPLARFVNAVLLGLNELRRCLLPGVVGHLQTALAALLVEVRQDLVANERAVHVPGMAKGPQTTQLRQAAVTYKELLATIIEPYLRGSLHAAVGNATAAQEQYDVLQANLQPPAPVEEENAGDENEEETTPEEANDTQEEEKEASGGQADGDDINDGANQTEDAEQKDIEASPSGETDELQAKQD